MFSKVIYETSLSGSIADQVFPRIQGDSFNSDNSFISTMRAILAPRMSEDDNIELMYRMSDHSVRTINGVSTIDLFNAALGIADVNNTIMIHSLRSSDTAARTAFLEKLDDPNEGFLKQYVGFVELDKIRQYFSTNGIMEARFYQSTARHLTLIVVDGLNIRRWHALASLIPKYCPWFFIGKPFTAEEKNLLASLSKNNSATFEKLIEDFASHYDMRSYLIKNLLGSFEKNARQGRLRNIDRQIADAESEMDDLMRRYTRYVSQLNDLNIMRAGIKEAINGNKDSDSELEEFFLCNKGIDPIQVDGSTLDIVIRTHLSMFDVDLFETMAGNEDSLLFHDYHISREIFKPMENRKKFLEALFGEDPCLKVRMCAYYHLSMNGEVYTSRGYSFPSNCQTYMPNPHLNYHRCLGDYERNIAECLRNGDMVGAVATCNASAQSVNLGEGPTMEYFLRDLFSTESKVIELPDGTCVSPVDAFNWLTKDKEG